MTLRTYLSSFALLCLSLTFLTTTQAQRRNCAVMDHLEHQLQKNPAIQDNMDAIEKHTSDFIRRGANSRNGVITIPTVVHVVYRTSTQNISEAQIQSQMQVLNDDFRRLNSDADNTWSQAADTQIEFCLASVDPNGNPTNGITRTSTTVSGFGTNDSMKSSSSGGKDAWPTDQYLNMWVCAIGGGILGYAQFPGSGSASTDGVVMDYQYFGTIGTATAPFDGGRTTTHEVGHWLNLRHIWGDGNCNADDFVSDTPTSDGANYGCATGHVSCNSTDMVQNYMDYSDDGCMNLFTAGQTARMRALFDAGGFRASLLNSNGCGNAGPAPTCNDGVQNGDETGVDCGGSSCQACPCNGGNVVISITLDNYPEETSWTLVDANGSQVGSGGTYGNQADGSTVTASGCLADGCYTFTINDAYGDGICCSYGNGSYNITVDGASVASGGSFGSSESKQFCIGGSPTPTCNDGVQNGNETGVDCGGSCPACPVEPTCNDGIQNGNETGVDCGGSCPACPVEPTCNDGIQNGNETGVDCGGSCAPCNTACSTVTINSTGFESGLGIWNDGGSDCRRSINDSAYANNGNYCVRLRDNTSSSTMTTDNLNLAGFESVTVAFSYYVRSFEGSEDFWLQFSLDGGSSYQTVVTFVRGTDFNNNERKNVSIEVTGNFTSSTRVRFRADASGNSDWVYIDDVTLTGCTTGGNRGSNAIALMEAPAKVKPFTTMKLFPNPADQIVNIGYDLAVKGDVYLSIVDLTGRQVHDQIITQQLGEHLEQIDVADLKSGYYFVIIRHGDTQITEKFVKM